MGLGVCGGRACILVLAVICLLGCQMKSPSPCLACRRPSSLIITDTSLTHRQHDPFWCSTISGPLWELRICQPCPFCSPGLCPESRAQGPSLSGLLHLYLYHTLSVSLSSHPYCPTSAQNGGFFLLKPLAMSSALSVPLRALDF